MNSELIKKLSKFLEEEEIEKEEEQSLYPISKKEAYQIANKDENLKTDFCRQDNREISYLGFNQYEVQLEMHKEEPYWHIQIKEADVSWYDSNSDELCDGFAVGEDLQKLHCFINAKTGEYYYQLQV